MLLIAIDPGASGALACSHDGGNPVIIKMPETPKDILDLLSGLSVMDKDVHVTLEDISHGVFVKDAQDARLKMTAMSKLHRHCGHLEGFLIALGIPFDSVSPQKWMKSHGVMPKDYAKRKRHIKDLMQRKWPTLKVTLWASDALGILSYQLERTK